MLLDEDDLIKCLFSAENYTMEEAIKTLPQLKNILIKKWKQNQSKFFIHFLYKDSLI